MATKVVLSRCAGGGHLHIEVRENGVAVRERTIDTDVLFDPIARTDNDLIDDLRLATQTRNPPTTEWSNQLGSYLEGLDFDNTNGEWEEPTGSEELA